MFKVLLCLALLVLGWISFGLSGVGILVGSSQASASGRALRCKYLVGPSIAERQEHGFDPVCPGLLES